VSAATHCASKSVVTLLVIERISTDVCSSDPRRDDRAQLVVCAPGAPRLGSDAQASYHELQDRLAGLLRSDTRALTLGVVGAGELTATMPKPILRDRVFAYFKRKGPDMRHQVRCRAASASRS
jgi:hypothetical protein